MIDVVPDDKNMPETGGWTLEAFRDHVGKQMAELDLRYQQRFEAQEKAMAAALAAAERAVLKAEAASEKRFESVNEFRSVLIAQSATLATKSEVDGAIKGLIDKSTDRLEWQDSWTVICREILVDMKKLQQLRLRGISR